MDLFSQEEVWCGSDIVEQHGSAWSEHTSTHSLGPTMQSLEVCSIPTFSLVFKGACMRTEALFVVT